MNTSDIQSSGIYINKAGAIVQVDAVTRYMRTFTGVDLHILKGRPRFRRFFGSVELQAFAKWADRRLTEDEAKALCDGKESNADVK